MSELKEINESNGRRVHFVCAGAVLGACCFYIASQLLAWPTFVYRPYQQTWTWANPSLPIVQSSFVGVVCWGIVGFLLGGLLGVVLSKLGQQVSVLRQVVTGWALLAAVLSIAFMFWTLWPL